MNEAGHIVISNTGQSEDGETDEAESK